MYKKTSFLCNSLTIITFLKAILNYLFKKNDARQNFAYAISSYFGVKENCIFLFGAGRMALYTILKSLNLNHDDEVIIPGYTCVVVPNAIKYLNIKAVYVDVVQDTLNINTNSLLKKITRNTRVIIITHNFGISYNDITKIKRLYPEIIIIEDCAHTIGSIDIYGNKVGKIGDASFFSMEYSKPITTGTGGILLINNKKLIEKVNLLYCELEEYPYITKIKLFVSVMWFTLTTSKYTSKFLGFGSKLLRLLNLLYSTPDCELRGEMPEHYPVRLSNFFAILGYYQMINIDLINEKKMKNAEKYNKYLSNINGTQVYFSRLYLPVRFPIFIKSPIPIEIVKRIRKRIMKTCGIPVGEWFNDVVHPKNSYRYNYNDGMCPVGEYISERILNLPINIHMEISDKDLITIRRILIEEICDI